MIPQEMLLAALVVKPALVVGIAFAITWPLRHRSPAARHAVWTGAILAVLALPLVSLTVPPLVVPVLPAPERPATPSVPAPYPAMQPRGPSGPGAPAWLAGEDGSGRIAVAVLWASGVLLLGVRRMGAHHGARDLVRRARACEDQDAIVALERIRRALGIRRRIDLRVSDEVSTPAVAGVLNPLILIPSESAGWTRRDMDATLTHEAAHIARGDGLWNRLAGIATAVFWPNPLVRHAARRMQAESERACDDEVIRSGADPESYARLLLRVARATRRRSSPGMAMASRWGLEGRLRALLDGRLGRRGTPRWMAVGMAALTLVAALPVAALTLGARSSPGTGLSALEPDRRGDAWSSPRSERIPLAPGAYVRSPRADDALAGPDSALAARLVAALDHTPEFEGDLIRDRAAWALSQTREGRLIDPMLAALRSPDWRVSSYAAWTLATEREPRAVPLLLPLLEHPVWRLRAMAAYALREIGDPGTEAAMTRALHDPAWQVRVEAVQYLTNLGGDGRRETIRPHLEDRHIAVRRAAQAAFLNL
jgi:beta-lactamase regulating signal transducer with metallopeptidase domain